MSAQNRSSTFWRDLMVFGQGGLEVRCLGWRRPARQDGEISRFHGVGIVGRHPGDARRGVEGLSLILSWTREPFISNKPLRDRASAAVELRPRRCRRSV